MWNDERIEELKSLHAEGVSASQIAVKIGAKSKNAVLGKLHRLGLCRGPRTKRDLSRCGSAGALAAKLKKAKPAKPKAPKPIAPAAEPLPVFEPLYARKTFDELEPNDCRNSSGDPREPGFGFCGLPQKPGSSYCPSCHARTHTSAPKSIGQLIIRGALARLG